MLLCLLAIMPFALGMDANESTTAPATDSVTRTDPSANKLHAQPRVRAQKLTDMAKQRLKHARERIQNAKDLRVHVLDQARTRRAQIKQLRKDLDNCKNVRTEECAQKRQNAQKDAIAHLEKAAEDVLAILEKTKQRVTDSDLAEERKQSLLANTERSIEAVLAVQDTITGFDETTTKSEIKNAAKALRSAWKHGHTNIKAHANTAAARKIGTVIEKSEKLQERLETAVSDLKAQGKDTSAIDLETLDEHLNDARNAYDRAVQLREKAQMVEGERRAEIIKQSNEALREAHAAIKEAHKTLREILRAIRAAKQSDASDLPDSDVSETTDTKEDMDSDMTEDADADMTDMDDAEETDLDDSDNSNDSESNISTTSSN